MKKKLQAKNFEGYAGKNRRERRVAAAKDGVTYAQGAAMARSYGITAVIANHCFSSPHGYISMRRYKKAHQKAYCQPIVGLGPVEIKMVFGE